jgi:hypothetical protein
LGLCVKEKHQRASYQLNHLRRSQANLSYHKSDNVYSYDLPHTTPGRSAVFNLLTDLGERRGEISQQQKIEEKREGYKKEDLRREEEMGKGQRRLKQQQGRKVVEEAKDLRSKEGRRTPKNAARTMLTPQGGRCIMCI